MRAIIIGRNRVVLGKVKLKEWENNHWYLCGTQLYKMYPDGLTRMITTRYGSPSGDDEALVFNENGTVPYHPRTVSYEINKVLSEIDEHKMMTSAKPVGIIDLVVKKRRELSGIAGVIPILVAGIILIYALVFS